MGYTHSWYLDAQAPRENTASVAADLRTLLPRLEDEMGAGLAGADGIIGREEITDGRIIFNGPGDGACEPFVFGPGEGRIKRDGTLFSFCKTEHAPYDLAVKACLLAAKHHYGRSIEVYSDGKAPDWADAAGIVREVLGYGGSVEFCSGGGGAMEVRDAAVHSGPAKPLEAGA